MKKTATNTANTPADLLTQAYYEAKAERERSLIEYHKHIDNTRNLNHVKQHIRAGMRSVIQYTDTPLTASQVVAKSGGTLNMVYSAAPRDCCKRKEKIVKYAELDDNGNMTGHIITQTKTRCFYGRPEVLKQLDNKS